MYKHYFKSTGWPKYLANFKTILTHLGLFKYEDKVTKFWPEFGQNGKQNVQICDILRHECGLPSFTKPLPSAKNAWTENLKDNIIGKFIEDQTQKFPTDTGVQI